MRLGAVLIFFVGIAILLATDHGRGMSVELVDGIHRQQVAALAWVGGGTPFDFGAGATARKNDANDGGPGAGTSAGSSGPAAGEGLVADAGATPAGQGSFVGSSGETDGAIGDTSSAQDQPETAGDLPASSEVAGADETNDETPSTLSLGDDKDDSPLTMPVATDAPTAQPTAMRSATSQPAATIQPTAAPVIVAALGPEAAALLAAMNAARADAGVPPLTATEPLQTVAQAQSNDMALSGRLSHDDSHGRGLSRRLTDGRVPFAVAGENVAKGHGGAKGMPATAQAFLNSPVHRANVLNPDFAECGIGITSDGQGGAWITVDFTG